MNKFEIYQTAVDSVKDALIEALNTDEETNTLSEIWRHYLGLRAIADKAAGEVSESIFGDTLTFVDSKNNYWEDDGISLTGNPGGMSADTISFG